MQVLVLDPRNGDDHADLYVFDPALHSRATLRLGYVPELHCDAARRELVVVETELEPRDGAGARYWLKCFDTESWGLKDQREIGERPMYAGFPGRSYRVTSSPSGRYLYALQSHMIPRLPEAEDVFRVTVVRYDRQRRVLEAGRPIVDSCLVDFGCLGNGDEDLYFHMSCDFPSTVAFAKFSSPELEWVRLEETPARTHLPQETCSSWRAGPEGPLYCITREGKIFQVRRGPTEMKVLTHLELGKRRSIPLSHLDGCGDSLFVGVAGDDGDRSLGLASEVWRVARADGSVVRVLKPPTPIMNFVATPDGRTLYGVDPYEGVLFSLDAATGKPLAGIRGLGNSPAEVLLLP
jgi:hypothetical protein